MSLHAGHRPAARNSLDRSTLASTGDLTSGRLERAFAMGQVQGHSGPPHPRALRVLRRFVECAGLGQVPRGALFYLTPSHQFPTGALLPLRRRVEFLELAADAEGLVLEDDYDSEFRFRVSPSRRWPRSMPSASSQHPRPSALV